MIRNNLSTAAFVISAPLVACGSALAHPGHGVDDATTATHYLLSPSHLPAAACMLGIAAAVVAAMAVRRFRTLQRTA